MFASLAPVATLLASVALVMAGYGLQVTVLPLRAELEGFSAFMIGAGASGHSVGFVIGCLAAPYAIARAGHIRSFAAIISFGSAVALLHAVIIDAYLWVLFRAITGFCIAGFYLIIESWLNDRASNETRGFVLSSYVVVISAGIISGQMLVALGDAGDFVLFAVASVIVSLAVVPVAMTRSAQPAPITLVRLRPRLLYNTSPAAFISVLIIGVTTGSVVTLAPLYATGQGYSLQFAAIFSAAIFAGGALLQWPLGRASDLTDRRYLLIICAIGAILFCALLTFTQGWSTPVVLGMAALVGGFTQPAYAIANAHAFDYVEPEDYVETSTGFLIMFGIGGSLGPVIAASLMQTRGPDALFAFVAAGQLVMAIFLLMRLRSRGAAPSATREEYDYASTAPVVAMGYEEAWDTEEQQIVPESVGPVEPASYDGDKVDEPDAADVPDADR
jgi:MFS family permease